MTTSEVFRDYLGMTPESAPWAFGVKQVLQCLSCLKDVREVPVDEQAFMGVRCDYCCEYLSCGGLVERLTATSPLAPNPDHGWLYVMVTHKDFLWLDPQAGSFFAAYRSHNHNTCRAEVTANPIHAVCRALIAADPDLRARLGACEDWKEVQA